MGGGHRHETGRARGKFEGKLVYRGADMKYWVLVSLNLDARNDFVSVC